MRHPVIFKLSVGDNTKDADFPCWCRCCEMSHARGTTSSRMGRWSSCNTGSTKGDDRPPSGASYPGAQGLRSCPKHLKHHPPSIPAAQLVLEVPPKTASAVAPLPLPSGCVNGQQQAVPIMLLRPTVTAVQRWAAVHGPLVLRGPVLRAEVCKCKTLRYKEVTSVGSGNMQMYDATP